MNWKVNVKYNKENCSRMLASLIWHPRDSNRTLNCWSFVDNWHRRQGRKSCPYYFCIQFPIIFIIKWEEGTKFGISVDALAVDNFFFPFFFFFTMNPICFVPFRSSKFKLGEMKYSFQIKMDATSLLMEVERTHSPAQHRFQSELNQCSSGIHRESFRISSKMIKNP